MGDLIGDAPGHVAVGVTRTDGKYLVECECGSKWVHGPQDDEAEIKSIYQSHLAYFNKPATVIL